METDGEPPILPKESALLERALQHQNRCTNATTEADISPDSSNIDWVSIRDFTVDVGKEQIIDYIETWGLPPAWLYCVNVLCTTEDEHRSVHHYRANFSTPTKEKPIETRACVFFAVNVPKVAARSRPVEVLFMIESNRLVHTPGTTTFREQWLTDVIESKNLLREAADL
ncbi:A-kinase anchor protein 14 [Nelusetta ayraudi]|uniref:A-kinase anchor protein 14 n=1 Tax=Nelusetta ayraudi TaxID=303726 RepID=UPI003F6FA97C